MAKQHGYKREVKQTFYRNILKAIEEHKDFSEDLASQIDTRKYLKIVVDVNDKKDTYEIVMHKLFLTEPTLVESIWRAMNMGLVNLSGLRFPRITGQEKVFVTKCCIE